MTSLTDDGSGCSHEKLDFVALGSTSVAKKEEGDDERSYDGDERENVQRLHSFEPSI